ncbi:DUF3823 domain-containing protein [Fibrella forsythiae]|uniref:DUF3823 domain-containing protein n=1 Tax=Fibrella forsythiae TaxID=2817061 RepID=A0ABS3JPL9_9BACT|nr:DUF3823 domain-containing protein [Fibrella forsythiae]MBO0951433.1 DUF3823 domain-containing protein [Fibrella forsythiae]
MKTFSFPALALLLLGLAACDKDNFEPPKSTFAGRIVYKGEPLLMQSANVATGNVSDFPVFIELWQQAYNNRSSIRVPVAQDGSFTSLLFDGDYKLIVPNGQGPFLWKRTAANNPDSLTLNLRGSQQMDIEVTPYYMVRSPQFTVSGRKVAGSVKLEKVITDAVNGKTVERVSLYVNKSQFVDAGNSILAANLAGSAITDLNTVNLTTADVPALVPSQSYVYVRIGLKITGVEDMIYTPVQKVTLQ